MPSFSDVILSINIVNVANVATSNFFGSWGALPCPVLGDIPCPVNGSAPGQDLGGSWTETVTGLEVPPPPLTDKHQ